MRKYRPGQGQGEQAQQHYLIRPRHLAGGGDVRHVAEFLRASGWKMKTKPGRPLVLDSPDRTIRIAYDPQAGPGAWTIAGKATTRQEGWTAVLDARTPVEILAGFTDALTRPRTAHAPNVWAPLRQKQWTMTAGAGSYTIAVSPDGTAGLAYQPIIAGHARWAVRAGDDKSTAWLAYFSATTPMHLVQAFSAALADPAPVMRPRGRVPHSAKIRTTSVSVLPSQLRGWQQARLHAAHAATWARKHRPGTKAGPLPATGHTRTRR
ncbi:DUF317 domain-containing protein [Streptomyces sp. DSM 42041]|uniref:DUF317 domain-containing protein n=1 Tax=Streptomyces hazeniae TaxID=3075538 RepID=A0ABU2P003_9ACTN|nr:DUF317 domain-containing protein [Streptomyces sp. DSM 42041]MDT0382558.1 DUF317 domain-containing protein [Streptomyces sp. DSM 42041]